MVSNWRLNIMAYGLIEAFATVYAEIIRVPMCARILGTDLLLTNQGLAAAEYKPIVLVITGDDRVSFDFHQIARPHATLRFPYGFAVEPDQPP